MGDTGAPGGSFGGSPGKILMDFIKDLVKCLFSKNQSNIKEFINTEFI